MKISFDRPPLWDKIDAAFHVAGKPVIFAWGDTVFNPERVPMTKELHAHEEMHGERQFGYPCEALGWELATETWWQCYIDSPTFRLAEEIPAHQAEYRAYCKRHRGAGSQRARLEMIATKLASPLYGDGGLVSIVKAKELILNHGIGE